MQSRQRCIEYLEKEECEQNNSSEVAKISVKDVVFQSRDIREKYKNKVPKVIKTENNVLKESDVVHQRFHDLRDASCAFLHDRDHGSRGLATFGSFSCWQASLLKCLDKQYSL